MASCNPAGPTIVDCVWDDWSLWGACSVTCGDGEKIRSRAILTPAENGGVPCDAGNAREVRLCVNPKCGLWEVCVWSDWEMASSCSVTCGEHGLQVKKRNLVVEYRRGKDGKVEDSLVMRVMDLYAAVPAQHVNAILPLVSGLAAFSAAVLLARGVRSSAAPRHY